MRILVLLGLTIFLWSCYKEEPKGEAVKDTDAPDSIPAKSDSLIEDSLRRNVDMSKDKTQVNDSTDLSGRLPDVEAPSNGGL